MSVIQKIRSKYAKLAGFVIALALVGFILMDAASGGLRNLFGNDTSIAKVNGEAIDGKDYSQRSKDYEILYAYGQQGQAVDDNLRAQINSEALRDIINEKLVIAECEKIGITSTKEEEKDLIYGTNPDPIVQQYQAFRNPETNMFDPQYVKAFEQQVDQYDPSGKAREQWETIKAYILRTNLLKKYNAAVSKGIYMPGYMIKFEDNEQNKIASINFVKIDYSTIPDKDVPVKDEELKAYMKKHEGQFKINEPSRTIEFISFDIVPSADDTARALDALSNIKAELAATTEKEKVESLVNRNSDEAYKGDFVNKSGYMSMYSDSIFSLPEGAVFGPYFENGAYKLTKVQERKVMPDSVKCRHILVKTADRGNPTLPDSVAKKKIDSAVAAINAGAPFAEVVAKYSEDEGSKQTAGEYTFTLQQKPGLSKEFGDFIFDGKTGESKLVKVENQAYAGYHYIEILKQDGQQPALKIATVSKALYAGENTNNAAYAQANEFAGKSTSAKAFDDAAKAQNLNKRIGEGIKPYDFSIEGLGPAREVVRWAYEEAEVGDVSGVFSFTDKFIVAKLTGVQKEGMKALDANLRQMLEPTVRNEKKAEVIVSKYKSMNDLNAIAAASQQQVQRVDSFNGSMQFVEQIGFEPKVVGYAFYEGFKPNTMSPAIKGNQGVFFTSLIERGVLPVQVDQAMVQQRKMMMESNMRTMAPNSVLDIMRKNADIKYNPRNF